MNLTIFTDENLKDGFVAPVDAARFVQAEKAKLANIEDPTEKVRIKGTIGVYCRLLGRLDEAESYLTEALSLIERNKLSQNLWVQQAIRRAHVAQWKQQFPQAEAMFLKAVSICETDPTCSEYLDFAVQHLGKCYFDQHQYARALKCFERALEIRRYKKISDLISSSEFAIEITQERMKL